MSLIIFGDSFSFPEGAAATNRIHTYAKGFIENGLNVHVICFASEYTSVGEGTMDGINYHHPFGQEKRNKYFLIRREKKFVKYIKTLKLIREINKKDKIIAFNCWTQSLFTQFFLYNIAHILKAPIILERSEHPLRNLKSSVFQLLYGKIKVYLEVNLCNGILCISRNLVDFYKNKGCNVNNLLLVPSTVDPGRFKNDKKETLPFNYIGYFGGLTFNRDNIDILIKSFAQISPKYPELHLVLGGFCSKKEKLQIKELIAELHIINKVVLLEYLQRNEIINYIENAHILVMVRSKNFETNASFPSKLTEFLATSNPVISVKVGEITDYLCDGINAFLINPGDVDSLAGKIIFILENYNLAQQVALKGKELTNSIFNYNFQAKKIIQFISSLN